MDVGAPWVGSLRLLGLRGPLGLLDPCSLDPMASWYPREPKRQGSYGGVGWGEGCGGRWDERKENNKGFRALDTKVHENKKEIDFMEPAQVLGAARTEMKKTVAGICL